MLCTHQTQSKSHTCLHIVCRFRCQGRSLGCILHKAGSVGRSCNLLLDQCTTLLEGISLVEPCRFGMCLLENMSHIRHHTSSTGLLKGIDRSGIRCTCLVRYTWNTPACNCRTFQ